MSKVRVSVLLSVALAAAFASSAPAAIKFTRIYYDSPGADTGSNVSLNGEWFTVKNTGSSARSLHGWKVRDKAGHVYRFGSFRLGAGKTAKIHTGSGPTSGLHRYWGQDNYVWNNDTDKATLKKPDGTTADTCSYNNSSADSKVC